MILFCYITQPQTSKLDSILNLWLLQFRSLSFNFIQFSVSIFFLPLPRIPSCSCSWLVSLYTVVLFGISTILSVVPMPLILLLLFTPLLHHPTPFSSQHRSHRHCRLLFYNFLHVVLSFVY